LGAAADVAEIDLFSRELIERRDAGVGANDDVHLLVEQLGNVDDLVVDIADFAGAPEGVEQARLGDAEIDALEEADITDVLCTALADDRQDAELVAVIEDGRDVVGDRQIGGVDISRYDRDRVGIYPFTDAT
jgi:hypothetical protein